MDWRTSLHEKYRREFGCKNIGKVCWCEICVNIEKLIGDTQKEIKKRI
jgi:hypothetical protein